MGLIKGTLTFSRMCVAGSPPDLSPGKIEECLKRNAFQDRFLSAQEKVMGWTSAENILDSSFSGAQYSLGPYLLFSLRIDRKVIPPSLLKVRVMEAEKAYLNEKGLKKIYREQRAAIAEAVRADLLQKIQPVPAIFDVCWSVSTGALWFSSLSENAVQEFVDLFKQTFQIILAPLGPWDTPGLDKETREAIAATETQGGISELSVGREFMTWLWFKSAERNGSIMIPGVGDIELFFVRRLALASGEGDYSETVVCQGLHSDLREGKEALRRGKLIKDARISMDRDSSKWEFTFKADRLQFQSLKLPETQGDEEDDRSGRILERIYLVERAVETMDRLFVLFLQTRCSPAWEREFDRMTKWRLA
ncbi:MAG: recombination-associated protein RdgC [Syntrophales bacterium]